MTALRIVHVFTFFHNLGGVQSMLRRHLQYDGEAGFGSSVLSLFEPPQSGEPAVASLGLTWRNTIAQARRRFAHLLPPLQPDVVVYHNCWGVPFFAEFDQASRRLGIFHSDWTGIERTILAQKGFLDGLLAVSPQLVDKSAQLLPELAHGRLEFLPYPVDPPAVIPEHPPLEGRTWVFGFCGRVCREQKRVDRLPEFCRQLDDAGFKYRFEILGEGAEKPWLEKRLGVHPAFRFHGSLSGAKYWEALSQWDFIVFTSDYEGLPIALLEALSVGVLPVYPRIDSGGDPLVAAVDSRLLYPPGDFQSVVRALQTVGSLPKTHIAAWRATGRALVEPHLHKAYHRVFSRFTQRIWEMPPIAPRTFSSRPAYWTDHIPFGILRRVYIQGFLRRPSLP